MRQFLEAIWNAPAAEFTWFLGVLWSQFLYIVVVLLVSAGCGGGRAVQVKK